MPLSPADKKNLNELKKLLQNVFKPSDFENLVAALIGKLLGLSIAVAKSGFQHGGDAGPAARQGRRFRIECKKYKDTTSLSDRELLGEIDHALDRDKALEAWFLVSTRSVSEQLVQNLTLKGERIGVPIVILDWKNGELSSIAALCAFAPDLVEEFSMEAGKLSQALQPISADAITMLRHDLQSWCLGFETLRIQSHEKLNKLWNSPRESNADLGQDAAGGAQTKKIIRTKVHEALNKWWSDHAKSDAPVAVIGWDGVGKTWATLNWLVEKVNEQPILLIIPSSSVAALSGISETSVRRFLADCLYELTKVRNSEHWLLRLDYLFKRPSSEGHVMTIFFDGLNQESSVNWLQILKILQGEYFLGRVRVVVSTRNFHFEEKLSRLRGLIIPPITVEVDIYDTSSGGELDQMLMLEGLSRSDLHSDLIELARTPRLFKLVVRFRDRLVEAGQVTIHRLLWEYGRDTLGIRAGKSFSESEWKAWLSEIAQKYRNGIKEFSLRSLGETTNRPDLSANEVQARLSDIIDGQFAKLGTTGTLQLSSVIVSHALGAAVLAHLDALISPTFTSLNSELMQWLDPITGLDQRAEILRAAVSILVEQQDTPMEFPLAGVLVTGWLQTQNVTDSHRQELTTLAPKLTYAILDAIEHSDSHAQSSARLWAVNALRAIPRNDMTAFNIIIARVSHWFSIVSRDVYPQLDANTDSEKLRADKFKRKIGTDTSGLITINGLKLELVDLEGGALKVTAPSILEGFRLVKAIEVFEMAAVNFAIRDRCEGWDGLKWLCLLNEVDPEETSLALRTLSKKTQMRKFEPEVNAELPARIAALLLWMSGQESDEIEASLINPQNVLSLTYEKDYLPQPGRSFFALERRHAEIVLNDTGLPLLRRVQRTKDLWLDPNFKLPATFINEVREIESLIDVERLNRSSSYTIEDNNFEELEPMLARCVPDRLADLLHRKMRSIATVPPESRYWSGIHVTDHLLLADDSEFASANALRLSSTDSNEDQESFVASQLLLLELQNLNAQTQIDALIQANLKFILRDFGKVICPPTTNDVDILIARYLSSPSKQQDDLLQLLSIHPVKFSDFAWSWVEDYSQQVAHQMKGVAFMTLAKSDAAKFGQTLADDGWCWNTDTDLWVSHYGTGALIEATRSQPFDKIVSRLAPWRLLEAARLRGSEPSEIKLAAEIFDQVLTAEKINIPDLGSILTVDRSEAKSFPFKFSVSSQASDDVFSNPIEDFKHAMDTDEQIKRHQLATDAAISRINDARASGASLYLANVNSEDFVPVLKYASTILDNWLEGVREITHDFRRRVYLAEEVYLGLCETLLNLDPIRGVQLWRALREIIAVRYNGAAGVDDLLHMVFRAPDSSEVNTLRDELVELKHCVSDRVLFDLAIAATFNGKSEWLNSIIRADLASTLSWKRKRGLVLKGFTTNNILPVNSAWPKCKVESSHGLLEVRSARFQWVEACAHYWWCTYLDAKDTVNAYAAWVLFISSADSRVWSWLDKEILAREDTSPLYKLKLTHFQINRSKLERAIEKRVEKLDKKLFDREVFAGLGPWH